MAGNGLRRELQNRNFIQWCNTLGNTRRITKLPVGGYCSCLSLLSTRILSLVPYPTQKRIFPSHLRISLSFFLLSFVFSFLFIYSLPSSSPPLSLSPFLFPGLAGSSRSRCSITPFSTRWTAFPLSRMPKIRSSLVN